MSNKFPKKSIIDTWLDENGDPAITKQVERNLEIANRIKELLDEKSLKPVNLAQAMGKSESEISKWLSGMHTLSQQTISKIEIVLSTNILEVTQKKIHPFIEVSKRRNFLANKGLLEKFRTDRFIDTYENLEDMNYKVGKPSRSVFNENAGSNIFELQCND